MNEVQIQKVLDRELSFFLRFYMAYDKPRARKLDEMVTLIGHSRAARLSLRYRELSDRIQGVIEANPDEYVLSDTLVWLNDSMNFESVPALPLELEAAVALEAPSTWPTTDYLTSESAFRTVCKNSLSKHEEFANEYVQLLGIPSADKKDRAAYSASSVHLLKLITSKPHQTKYGLKASGAEFDVLTAGDAMFNLHWAESKRIAGV